MNESGYGHPLVVRPADDVTAAVCVAVIRAEPGLGVDTIKTYLNCAFDALGARNRAHAVALALRSGQIVFAGGPR